MKHRKTTASLLVFLLLFLSLAATGCWDREEPEDLAFVIALGVDPAPKDQVLVTVQIALPKRLAGAGAAGGGGGGGGEGPSPVSSGTTFILSVVNPSIISALDVINTNIGRKISLQHNRVLVVGEEMARQGISRYIAALSSFREVRHSTYLITTRGRAAEFIRANAPFIEANPVKYIEEIATSHYFSGFLPSSQYHTFLNALESHGQNPLTIHAAVTRAGVNSGENDDAQSQIAEAERRALPGVETGAYLAGEVPRAGGNRVEFIGSAVYRGASLVGFLDGTETRLALILRGEFHRGFVAFSDPIRKGFFVPVDLQQARPPSVKVSLENGVPVIRVQISLEGSIEAVQGGISYAVDPAKKTLERAVEEEMVTRCNRLITRAQQELQADIFAFGDRAARKLFPTWEDWVRFGWLEKFLEARIDVQVSFKVRRVGLQFESTKPVIR